ncbi:MAG: hypothetical protein QOJ11_2972 [Frankiales bacterium]|nr:hypothetical protein [Frankiales bacterium]
MDEDVADRDSAPTRPTPLTVARLHDARRRRSPAREAVAMRDSDIAALIRVALPRIAWLLEQVGIPLEEGLAAWLSRGQREHVVRMCTAKPTARDVVAAWVAHLESAEKFTLLASLVFEHHLSMGASEIPRRLPRRFTYEKTLHVVRQRVAITLHDQAREINWRRPVVFVRALKLARHYLRDVVASEELTQEFNAREFTGRLGVTTILISRFEDVSLADLQEAQDCLFRSLSQGNSEAAVIPYCIEGALRFYDKSGDVQALIRAINLDKQASFQHNRPAAWHLSMAEIWLRLCDEASNQESYTEFRDRARAALDRVDVARLGDAQDAVRLLMLRATISLTDISKQRIKLQIRGLSFPFAVRREIEGLPTLVHQIAPEVIASLRRDAPFGEPLRRAILAELLSAESRLDLANPQAQVWLREAIDVRNNPSAGSPLTDERNRLEAAQDTLLLAALSDSPSLRRQGLSSLVRETILDETATSPIVMIAQDVELHGPIAVPLIEQEMWVNSICLGDSVALYAEAAKRALRSHDVSRRGLGGRSNVVTVEDYFGFTSQTFVFKATTELCQARDAARSIALGAFLVESSLGGRFGVIEHIAVASPEELDQRFSDREKIVTVRRYAESVTLSGAIQADRSSTVYLLTEAAEFLAIIHSLEARGRQPTKAHMQLKSKELGRWLRDGLRIERPGEVFEAWWAAVRSLPQLPRRDAHALNWLVSADQRILAVDFEATGWRPVGYELAQLTDDQEVLPASDLAVRHAILDTYVQVLERYGLSVDASDAWIGYQAGLIARAVRDITDPLEGPQTAAHGRRLLASVAAAAQGELAGVCSTLLERLHQRDGTKPGDGEVEIGEGRSRRVSRAMAFHLRHDEKLSLGAGGWIDADLLSARMRESGIFASASEIRNLAGSISEPRFEISAGQVRAIYGHSRQLELTYESRERSGLLYHATTISSIRQIVTERQGLSAMARQWVHLSEDPNSAVRSGRRHGYTLLLSVDPTRVAGLAYASGITWLAPSVPLEALSIVPLYSIFDA